MEELKEKYSNIISSWIPFYKDETEDTLFSVSIRFTDESRLEVRERFIKELNDRRYSYQYMRSDNTLIIRWDNTPKHLEVGLHHMHVGSDSNVQPSDEMTLQKVLSFIAKALGFAG